MPNTYLYKAQERFEAQRAQADDWKGRRGLVAGIILVAAIGACTFTAAAVYVWIVP